VEGTPFGRYQLLELLGRGGMGEVWRAYDTTIDRVVALKMLLPHYAQDPEFDKRFRREARAAARLDDPHVVPIYDVGEIDGRLYVTMRLINGTDLQTMLNAGPLPAERAVHIVEQIASALNDAHQAGLVHRDVKPSNILVSRDDFAYLIDFGIARGTGDTALTSANTTIGTWSYMAPERFNTGEVGPGSDVYALACVLYQCLTGELPFPGTTLEQVAVSHMMMPPPRPSAERDTVPTELDEVIATALAKKPTDRYHSTVEMAAAARHALAAPMGSRHPIGATPPPAPAFLPPPGPPVPPVPTGTSGRTLAILSGALLGVVLLVAAGIFAIVRFSQNRDPTTAAPSSSTTPAPTMPPFTGTYRVDYTAATRIDGGPLEGAVPQTATWGLRSTCRADGCVATAFRLGGDGPPVSNLEFDEIDGRWVAVALASDECRNASDELWDVFTLAPNPDGTLTGDVTGTSANACSGTQRVTFTRTGDVDVENLVDPATLSPRVVSPAEALYGRYRSTRSFANGLPQLQGDYEVTTYCVRTGDRCMSYFHSAADFRPLVFDGGTWTLDAKSDGLCNDGKPFDMVTTGKYPLPDPPTDPIRQLAGHGHVEQTNSTCNVSTDFDETFTRTGD